MQVTFVPSLCTGENAEFSGTVTLRKPTYDERAEMIIETAEIRSDIEQLSEKQQTIETLKYIRVMVAQAKKFYVDINLEMLSTGEKITNYDELETCHEAGPIITEIAMKAMKGFSSGK